RNRDDVEIEIEVVKPDADRPSGLVERRPNVDVVPEAIPTRSLQHERAQLVHGWHWLHHHDPARAADPLHVLSNFERVQLALLLVPVRPNALEDRGPVHERVGHDADLRVAHRYELALEVADVLLELRRRG